MLRLQDALRPDALLVERQPSAPLPNAGVEALLLPPDVDAMCSAANQALATTMMPPSLLLMIDRGQATTTEPPHKILICG